jgi:hypothetical protein
MTTFLVELDWWRDPKGYRLEGSEANPRERRVVRRGGKLVPCRPLDRCEDLFRIFANHVRSAETLLEFVNNFGALTRAGDDPKKGDPVAELLDHAGRMRELLRLGSEPRLFSLGNGRLEELLSTVWRLGLMLGGATLSLIIDPATQSPRLRFLANSLLDGLWIQLGRALSGGASFGQCRHCGELFQRGRGHRRIDAQFCSDEHRKRFNSLERSREK